MSKQIKKATSDRYSSRRFRKARVRKKLSGTPECPRMNIFRSNSHFNIQIIDDDSGTTIIHCSTMEKDLKGSIKANLEGAKKLGKIVAERAIQKKIKQVVFDRNGFRYHGVIKAFADSAREAGLKI
jgi:large subunit ribosomal protein L18